MGNNAIKNAATHYRVPNSIHDIGLTAHEIAVYSYLCKCGYHGNLEFPSLSTIAKKAGMNERKVIDVLDSLEEKGVLERKKVSWRWENE